MKSQNLFLRWVILFLFFMEVNYNSFSRGWVNIFYWCESDYCGLLIFYKRNFQNGVFYGKNKNKILPGLQFFLYNYHFCVHEATTSKSKIIWQLNLFLDRELGAGELILTLGELSYLVIYTESSFLNTSNIRWL